MSRSKNIEKFCVKNVEKWGEHEEKGEGETASRGAAENAEDVSAEGHVLPWWASREPDHWPALTTDPLLTMIRAGKMVAEQPDLCGGKVSANKAGQRLHTNTSKLSRIL